ncbi:hypothetical protein oki361_17410 [Helicobacter pylori]
MFTKTTHKAITNVNTTKAITPPIVSIINFLLFKFVVLVFKLGVSNFSNISNFFAAACPSLVSKLDNLINFASIGLSNTISLVLLLLSQVISFSISLKLIPSFETKTFSFVIYPEGTS